MKKKKIEIEEKIVIIFCSFICVFVNSSIESLSALIFFIFELNFSISFISSSVFLNLKKCEFVQKRKKKFFNEKLVIKNNVSNLYETNNSSFLSLNKFCVEIIKIERKKEKKSNFFVSNFLWSTFYLIIVNIVKKKILKKKKMFFEIFNQYRKNRSIFDESDAKLIQKAFAKRKLSKSTFREKRTTSVTKRIV
jgi:hypothetical protein